MSADIAMIAEVPIFELLDQTERAALAEMMDCREFKSGTVLFEYGDPGGEIFVLRSGNVEVFVENHEGEKIILAREDTQTLSMHRERLLNFIDKHPHAAIDLLTVVGRRLRATDELLRTHVSRNVNVEQAERMTLGERVADRVASFGGSWTFIIIFGAVMLVWVCLNTVALFTHHFDPYPYILLNLFLSMTAAVQAPVIMMSQNRQATKDRLQADQDYQVNLKAELEVAHLHRKMDHLYERLEEHWARLENHKS